VAALRRGRAVRRLALVLAVAAGVTLYAQELPCQPFCRGNSCLNNAGCSGGCNCAKTQVNVRGICASVSPQQTVVRTPR
jgi:hypothetical protein